MQANGGLTSKDLSVLQDQMDAEYRANRKASTYAKTLQDPALQGIANTLAQHHRARFDALYNFLGGNN
ncbi:MAG: hypothetical protein LBS11_02895 [Oscillospiraceae bacterium]|jgi:hypothetical protein|nr:hypothetical protein [Oscillospiraceae bacterium]